VKSGRVFSAASIISSSLGVGTSDWCRASANCQPRRSSRWSDPQWDICPGAVDDLLACYRNIRIGNHPARFVVGATADSTDTGECELRFTLLLACRHLNRLWQESAPNPRLAAARHPLNGACIDRLCPIASGNRHNHEQRYPFRLQQYLAGRQQTSPTNASSIRPWPS
jgi:hypothetical protein